ncbi:MAG: hypothetical protein KatS3mg108_3233 [Isosphaeraceae bacterium]|jgi:hypothetical protein|nr:MAG: hypothetical protein KatS3mg108_3233 [Isosphaeraceae bacterium]
MRIGFLGVALAVALALAQRSSSAQPSPWSPDGSWIAYVLTASPPPASPDDPVGWFFFAPSVGSADSPPPAAPHETLWATHPTSGDSVVLDQVGGMLTDPAWTTDGRGLVYGRLLVSDDLRTARFELILKQSLDSERILAAWPWRRRTPTLDEQARRCVAISSSGSWVVAPDPDAPGLVLIERPSGRVARHLDNACRPSWSPETDWLAFVRDSDPPRVELLDPAASEPLVLATLPGLGPSGFPSPFWSPDESSVSLLVPAGPPDGPFALRLERFRVDPPGPEPAWLLNEPPAPSLAPDAAAGLAFLDDNQLFLSLHGHGRSSQIAWLRGQRGEVFKRFHPLFDTSALHRLDLNPRPGPPLLAVRLGALARALPPALCRPDDESLIPLVPDADARLAWQRQLHQTLTALLSTLERPVPGDRSPPPQAPSRLPLPVQAAEQDSAWRRMRRIAQIGDSLLPADPPPPSLPDPQRLALLVDRVLYPGLLGRTAEALQALDRLDPHVDDPDARLRLIGLRAQLTLTAGQSDRAQAILTYVDDETSRSGWLLLERPGQPPRAGDPYPGRPAWVDQLRAWFKGVQLAAPAPPTDPLSPGGAVPSAPTPNAALVPLDPE